MFFWKKRKSREMMRNLKTIQQQTNALISLESKQKKATGILQEIMRLLNEVKDEIGLRSEEEKAKPWLDVQYDQQIDALRDAELSALEKLRMDLEEHQSMIMSVENPLDFSVAAEMLAQEEDAIVRRENKTRDLFDAYERESLARRLRQPSEPAPAKRTSDGVSWSDIAKVVRQLGGWIVVKKGTNHEAAIYFPSAARPIPLSKDVHSGVIANNVRLQLSSILPTYKIPNKSMLVSAFAAGDITRAA